MLDITYLLFEPGLALDNSPVFESQLLDRIRVQTEAGFGVGVVCAVRDADRFRRVIGPQLTALHVPFEAFPDAGVAKGTLRAASAMRRFFKQRPSRTIYVRGPWASAAHWLAFRGRGPALVYDFRGDSTAEAAYFGGRKRLRHFALNWALRRAVRRAKFIYCVSKPAAEVIESRFGRSGAAVTPSCVDFGRFGFDPAKRASIRASTGATEDDVVLIYSGGAAKYQMVPLMLRVWAALSDDPRLRFVLLTNSAPAPGSEAVSVPGPIRLRLTQLSVDRSEIPGYLSAADIGFLLREDHQLNRVASPVKFAEYLACGLAVVTGRGTGDVSDMVAQRGLGAVAPVESPAEVAEACRKLVAEVRADRAGYSQRAMAAAKENFDWRAYVPVWRQTFEQAAAHQKRGAR